MEPVNRSSFSKVSPPSTLWECLLTMFKGFLKKMTLITGTVKAYIM